MWMFLHFCNLNFPPGAFLLIEVLADHLQGIVSISRSRRRSSYLVFSGGLLVGVCAALGVAHYLALCLWDLNAYLVFEY